jgi:hypothetical protein
MTENKFDMLADDIYRDYKTSRDFETAVVKFLHIITKLLVFYLAGDEFRGSKNG